MDSNARIWTADWRRLVVADLEGDTEPEGTRREDISDY